MGYANGGAIRRCFAYLLGVSCSVCAPANMTASEVERFANAEGPPPSKGRWHVVDKSTVGLGTPTPNRCNQVDGRLHWFLLSEEARFLLSEEAMHS
jgi:hypothetical protein